MKKLYATLLCALPLALGSLAHAQQSAPEPAPAPDPAATPGGASPMPGPTPPGASDAPPEEPKETIAGKSAKSHFIGKAVYNEADEKVGDINDVILSDQGQATHLIVGAGGFLGMGEHSVAIPFDKISGSGDKLMLQGYTKEQLKSLPKYELMQ
ncbi:MAG: PRC-barrel domain-containing protein [Candidimonas sp.]